MDWKAHLFFGVLFGAAFAHSFLHLSALDFAFYTAVSGACALLPDLDMRKSKSSKAVYGIALAAILLWVASWASENRKSLPEAALAFVGVCCAAAALDFLVRPRHREIMHSLLFLASASAVAYFSLGLVWASAFFFGYLSHLVADRCIKLT